MLWPRVSFYITQGHWCMMLFEFCIMLEVGGLVSGSGLNFTGLRNSRFTGNTDHLAQACDRHEVGELSPHLLTTSLGPLNRWDCQGERAVPQGGFAVIDQLEQWFSFSRVFLWVCACACSISALTLTARARAGPCMKRVLPVWEAAQAVRSKSLQASKQELSYIKSPCNNRLNC